MRVSHNVRVLTPDRAEFFTPLDGVDWYARVALDPLNPTEVVAVVRYDGDLGTADAAQGIVRELGQTRLAVIQFTSRLLAG